MVFNVRKELPSPSDYRLLNLRARAPKCQFEPFSLISLSGFLWLQCGRQVKSCFLFLDLGHTWSRRCQGESIWKMRALVYFVEVFFSFHEQSILKVESDCLPEAEFLLSSGLGHSHRCHRAMRWWDLELFTGVLSQDGDTQPALRTLWCSCLYHLITEHGLEAVGGACGAEASAGLSCFPGNFILFTQRGNSEAHDW